MNTHPVIATMIGDPAGIGPEVCVKAIASGGLDGLCVPLLIGDTEVVRRIAGIAGVSRPVERVESVEDAIRRSAADAATGAAILVLDPGGFDASSYEFGRPSASAGQAVLEWIRLGTGLGKSGQIQGLVMGPKNSAALKMAGSTAMIGNPAPDTYMLRLSGPLRVVPLTEHLRLTRAVEMVTPENVLKALRMLNETLVRWGLPRPRIGVAGINPHAMFDEDRERIGPAVEEARRLGIDAAGPLVPDAVFRMAIEGKYDAVVTMYHDQGQIAVKTVAFDGACTVHIGLPYVRIGIPHGTAFEIAGKGVARHQSALAAMATAARLAAGTGMF
jgi:4-hydroxy-L-threonine phosphate dehydrogenase PdxA